MAETNRASMATETASRIRRRLAASRWLLAAAVFAVLVAAFYQPASAALVAALLLALVAVALLVPPGRDRATETSSLTVAHDRRLDGLTGETLAAAVADPLVIVDGNGVVVHANAAATAAFGMLGAGVSVLLKFRTPEMQASLREVLEGRAVSSAADYVERVPMERVYRADTSAIGGGTGLYVLVFRDQSEARRIDRMRADFIANASHELRTPLASIAGFVETLRGPAKDDPAARTHFLDIMHSQTGRMARLIDDLLSLSRLEMKAPLPPAGKVDVAAVVEAVVASLRPLAEESGVVIESSLGSGPFEARGDRDELFQVFENLVENACKYGQAGGRVVVSVETAAPGGQAEIVVTVRDFGPGIPEEHIPRITERFYRVDVDTSRAQKGTGLGLAIVKHILTRHAARLSIRSRPGEGAAFSVHLPVRS